MGNSASLVVCRENCTAEATGLTDVGEMEPAMVSEPDMVQIMPKAQEVTTLTQLKAGAAVRVQGLKKMPHLNGLEATLVEQTSDKTWRIKMEKQYADQTAFVGVMRTDFLVPIDDASRRSSGDDQEFTRQLSKRSHSSQSTRASSDGSSSTGSSRISLVSRKSADGTGKQRTSSRSKKTPPTSCKQESGAPSGAALKAFGIKWFQTATQLSPSLRGNPHFKGCFDQLATAEFELSGDWKVFYHYYDNAAFLYEVQAAIAAALYDFPSDVSPLPRICMAPFLDLPDASAFEAAASPDIALDCFCSMFATGPGQGLEDLFEHGRWDEDTTDYLAMLDRLVAALCDGDSHMKAEHIMRDMINIASRYRLGGTGLAAGAGKPGSILQIFIRADLVDKLAYASDGGGEPVQSKKPISQWFRACEDFTWGRTCVVADPKHFLKPDDVRIFVASADAAVHEGRAELQRELVRYFKDKFATPCMRQRADRAIAAQ
eukprot:TRINITY_DN112652_c0_g1_i1.p1 TRINITY_DN112652_c0_g1~~TRINITY_DN112652_c0_g1_i1.p1  ORF type:complete len:487 (+),score=124.29 TRINITY_DN112652_c0_g1_i1:101-1561(+)